MLKSLARLLFGPSRDEARPKRYALGPPYGRRPALDDPPKHQRDAWTRDGFVVLPQVFSPGQLAAYRTVVDQVRTEVDDGKDEHGLGDRIGQLHQRHPELLDLAAAPQVLRFLTWAFGDDPVLFGSLNFERGSQQADHIDAIFFWPEPSYAMAGVWVALEDVDPDAGPLFYVPRSHTWPFLRSQDVVATRPELAARRAAAANLTDADRGALSWELYNAWLEDFLTMKARRKGESRPLPIKSGDVVIWHSLLAHGGSARKDPSLSRNSVVFHYIGRRTKLYTFEQFMLLDDSAVADALPQPMSLVDLDGRLSYMRYDYFVTHSDGKQVVHPLG
jgi:ectoine hydroxylase-related dioxygenase (phytanoyl-CoA dioxygenase family)